MFSKSVANIEKKKRKLAYIPWLSLREIFNLWICECINLHFQKHGPVRKAYMKGAMFLEMQNFAFREKLRVSREVIFQICYSYALQRIEASWPCLYVIEFGAEHARYMEGHLDGQTDRSMTSEHLKVFGLICNLAAIEKCRRLWFSRRRNGHTNRRIDRRTDPLIKMRSWRTHLKSEQFTSRCSCIQNQKVDRSDDFPFFIYAKKTRLRILGACYPALHPALSVRPSVHPSISPHFIFSAFLSSRKIHATAFVFTIVLRQNDMSQNIDIIAGRVAENSVGPRNKFPTWKNQLCKYCINY